MSLVLEVKDWCNRGYLILLQPASGNPIVRVICLADDLAQQVFGPWADTADAVRWTSLRADLDSFVEGRKVIAVAKHPFKGGKKSDFKRLYKAHDEVWEFRSRSPQPGLRILGRFAAKDIFIALRCSERRELGGPQSRAWRNEMVGCKRDWRRLFPAYDPFTGSNLYGYISNIILV
jgi:hypothetical protein